ncbi:hypothetical protein CAC42_6969 [Sphaceloma murrayae]|uniref:LysM domain-containing protein n=1 Tax=Sphaceloma murrayae TaxID=2082308 RepID=A0A2K1QQB3_9PEZI|nr:hypothetical protein CAC42_6969 [Sphaceloma murrayae]
MSNDACCICSSLLDTYDERTEKPIIPDRFLSCCGRIICTRCILQNSRYKSYCPYCQITTEPSALPQGLKDPPSYDTTSKADFLNEKKVPPPGLLDDEPPAYSEHTSTHTYSEKGYLQPAEDVLHFVTPDDSLQSLSLAYSVPINALRKTNNIFADHLLRGRKTVLIPGEYYKGGVSLSPQPLESPEEELKKSKIRRFMMVCKVPESVFPQQKPHPGSKDNVADEWSVAPTHRYDVAVMYLEQNEYDIDAAVQAFQDDEQWEKDHPMQEKGKKTKTPKSVGMRRFVGNASNGRAV